MLSLCARETSTYPSVLLDLLVLVDHLRQVCSRRTNGQCCFRMKMLCSKVSKMTFLCLLMPSPTPTCIIWFNFVVSLSKLPDGPSARVLSEVLSAAVFSVYDARSTLDRVRWGGRSLELLVRSGFVEGLLAAEALRGEGLGCWCIFAVACE